jgi:beta-phosphoglucomutase
MKELAAVIFDLDGVICSTDHYHYLAWKALADEEGIPFDETINNRLRGVSRLSSLEIILEKAPRRYSEEEKERLCEKKNTLYRSFLTAMSPASVSPEVRLTLLSLRKAGIPMAIGSSSKNTPLILEKIGLSSFFDAVADGNEITHSKPDPEVFLLAAKKIQQKPEVCLVVEDAVSGILAAKRGHFQSASIGEIARSADPDITLTVLSDILPLFSIKK